MTNNWSWLKIDVSGQAVIPGTSLEDYLSGLRGYIHCVVLPLQPDVEAAMTALEQRHFPPGTPANDEYHVVVVNWQVLWYIVSIPGSYFGTAREVLRGYNLRLVKGRPAIITDQHLALGEIAPLNAFPSAAVVTVSRRLLCKLQSEYDSSEYALFPVTYQRMYTVESLARGQEGHIAGMLLFPDQDIGDRVGRG